uniref:Uncharacterized protein n=1 Tax=Setaria digitata TaxID=48799 RepID=A0A915Q3L6_9BILA
MLEHQKLITITVAVGLNSPEVSSTLIAGTAALLKDDPQKFMHTVDDVQRTMQCCGFAGNHKEWTLDRTVHYFDPIEDESKVMLDDEAKNIWQPQNEEEKRNSAPLSCCSDNKKRCSKKRMYQQGCFKKLSRGIVWLMDSVGVVLVVKLMLSVLQEVMLTYVAVDSRKISTATTIGLIATWLIIAVKVKEMPKVLN